MNNYDKSLKLFYGQIRSRSAIKVLCVDCVYDDSSKREFVFLGFFTGHGGMRGLFSRPLTKEYFFGTLYKGEAIDSLNPISPEGVDTIPDSISLAIKDVWQSKKPITLSKGKRISEP